MKHGLSEDIWEQFSWVFSHYPAIRGVVLYGSRAKGEFRENSDIDLAVDAPSMSEQEFSRLWNEIDALPIVFKIDLVHIQALGNGRLLENIRQHGLSVFPAHDKA